MAGLSEVPGEVFEKRWKNGWKIWSDAGGKVSEKNGFPHHEDAFFSSKKHILFFRLKLATNGG